MLGQVLEVLFTNLPHRIFHFHLSIAPLLHCPFRLPFIFFLFAGTLDRPTDRISVLPTAWIRSAPRATDYAEAVVIVIMST